MPQADDEVSQVRVSPEPYRVWGDGTGEPVRIVCAVSCPLASAASTVPISGPAYSASPEKEYGAAIRFSQRRLRFPCFGSGIGIGAPCERVVAPVDRL